MTAIVLDQVDEKKRRFLIVATTAAGAVAAGGVAVPFLGSWFPSARALAAGAPVEVDVSKIEAGQQITVEWRGKPVWVLRRTPEMIEEVRRADGLVADPLSTRTAFPTPPYARNDLRSIKPEWLIVVGICSHLGCSPIGPFAAGSNPALGNEAGFLCPCHGSTFDLAGRVFKNKPAPDNLEVPPYKFLSDTLVLIGDDSKA